jgi:hypothetical protein
MGGFHICGKNIDSTVVHHSAFVYPKIVNLALLQREIGMLSTLNLAYLRLSGRHLVIFAFSLSSWAYVTTMHVVCC